MSDIRMSICCVVPKSCGLLHLPNEVLVDIMSRLSDGDVLAFGQCCRRCFAVSRTETIWQSRCKEFHISDLSTWKSPSFFQLYISVIMRNKKYFGLWVANEKPEGGLVSIWPCDGVITVDVLRPPCLGVGDMTEAPTPEHRFVLETSGESVRTCSCVAQGGAERYPATLSYKKKPQVSVRQQMQPAMFPTTKCVDLSEDSITFTCKDYRFVSSTSSKPGPLTVFRVFLPPPSSLVPFKTGIYKGTYGPHGIELVCVEVVDNQIVRAVKFKGDENVPCGCVTFTFKLDDKLDCGATDDTFLLPEYFNLDGGFDVDKRAVLARYSGQGQLALVGYQNSCWSPVTVVVFSDTFLGVLWSDLESMSLFRYENRLPIVDCARWSESNW